MPINICIWWCVCSSSPSSWFSSLFMIFHKSLAFIIGQVWSRNSNHTVSYFVVHKTKPPTINRQWTERFNEMANGKWPFLWCNDFFHSNNNHNFCVYSCSWAHFEVNGMRFFHFTTLESFAEQLDKSPVAMMTNNMIQYQLESIKSTGIIVTFWIHLDLNTR